MDTIWVVYSLSVILKCSPTAFGNKNVHFRCSILIVIQWIQMCLTFDMYQPAICRCLTISQSNDRCNDGGCNGFQTGRQLPATIGVEITPGWIHVRREKWLGSKIVVHVQEVIQYQLLHHYMIENGSLICIRIYIHFVIIHNTTTAQCSPRQHHKGGAFVVFLVEGLPMVCTVQLVTPYTRMNPGISNCILPHGPLSNSRTTVVWNSRALYFIRHRRWSNQFCTTMFLNVDIRTEQFVYTLQTRSKPHSTPGSFQQIEWTVSHIQRFSSSTVVLEYLRKKG